MNNCTGRKGSFPYMRATQCFLLCVTLSINQAWLLVVPSVHGFTGAELSSPDDQESTSSAQVMVGWPRVFLELFCDTVSTMEVSVNVG